MRRPDPDVLAGGCAAVVMGGAAAGFADRTWVIPLCVALGATLGLVRRRPLPALLVAAPLMLAAAHEMFANASDPLGVFGLILETMLAFGFGRWGGRRLGLAAGVVLAAATAARLWYVDFFAVGLLFSLTACAVGSVIAERTALTQRLSERADELAAERDAYAQLSVRYERARIASELHDIVAHAISVMVVQASAGQRIAAVDPALAGETFTAIGDAARQAEADMGRLVALLSDEAATGPAPDIALVEELVTRAAGSGLDVTLRLTGDREGLPPAVGHAAYRVVQEGITNALRYASGARVTVGVDGGPDALIVEVANGVPQRTSPVAHVGTGNGLRGLRERIAACGGTLEAGPTGDGGWSVRVRLPRGVASGTLSGARHSPA